MFLLFKTFAILQNIEEVSQVELAFNSIENLLLFIFSAMAITALILIPVVLCFSMFDNYFSYHKYRSKIDKEICCHREQYNEKLIQRVCTQYLKSYSNFVKNALGLAAWNIFSLIYIAFAFTDVKTGALEYFHFPFHVVETFNTNDILSSFSQFSSNWYSMLAISILTFGFYYLGKIIGLYFGKIKIKKRSLIVSLN